MWKAAFGLRRAPELPRYQGSTNKEAIWHACIDMEISRQCYVSRALHDFGGSGGDRSAFLASVVKVLRRMYERFGLSMHWLPCGRIFDAGEPDLPESFPL